MPEATGAPYFPPPHPFETYLFGNLKALAQGYLLVPWGSRKVSREVREEASRRENTRLEELEKEKAERERLKLEELALKRTSSRLCAMSSWVTTALTRLRLKISAPFSRS
ncbi:hypothetical protein CF113_11830 [Aeromonas veronii]|nr:hypothetical protein CF113_11830 [Aeromonas veronii]